MAVLNSKELLIIEPFYGQSHKKLINVLSSGYEDNFDLITMSAKKWHWRARTSALYCSQKIPYNHTYKVLFCTSVLPLAELLGLRPDLQMLRKILYFHENQLTYPVRDVKERDFQYGFNEIVSCLTADIILFNSEFNKISFLENIDAHLKLQPDYIIKGLPENIMKKIHVVYFPVDIAHIDRCLQRNTKIKSNSKKCPINCQSNELANQNEDSCSKYELTKKNKEDKEVNEEDLHIVWPHRWEFDKNPESFCNVICKLAEDDVNFKVSILGQSFSEKPDTINKLSNILKSRLLHCGYIEEECAYFGVLKNADVVVSTALHEFFGVSVMEAVYCGCMPLVPNRLVYPELYPKEYLYSSDKDLYEQLRRFCEDKKNKKLSKTVFHLVEKYRSDIWLKNMHSIIGIY